MSSKMSGAKGPFSAAPTICSSCLLLVTPMTVLLMSGLDKLNLAGPWAKHSALNANICRHVVLNTAFLHCKLFFGKPQR